LSIRHVNYKDSKAPEASPSMYQQHPSASWCAGKI
jgi:hypothetical protein